MNMTNKDTLSNNLNKNRKFFGKAYAKLLISGEYSILYGMPAIACTINKCTITTITSYDLFESNYFFNLVDINYTNSLSPIALNKIKIFIEKRYSEFLLQQINIKDVIQKPEELILYTTAKLFDLSKHYNVKININSTIPIQYGLGSSAASIISCTRAIQKFLFSEVTNQPSEVTNQLLISFCTEIEHLQHGRSSGIDVMLSANKGCYYITQDRCEKRTIKCLNIFLVFTGRSESITGECVEFVKNIFDTSSIKYDFFDVTRGMDNALQIHNKQNNIENIKHYVKQNHILLSKIGVVPNKVKQFILECEKNNGAAKICGAGSIKGDNAGVVIAFIEEDLLLKLTKKYNYQFCSLETN